MTQNDVLLALGITTCKAQELMVNWNNQKGNKE
jgi:hypothetical protein